MRNDISAIVHPERPREGVSRIARDGNNTPLGVAVYVSAEELSEFGMDPETADAVKLTVDNGEVSLVPICWSRS